MPPKPDASPVASTHPTDLTVSSNAVTALFEKVLGNR
jgi:hypothetical protein